MRVLGEVMVPESAGFRNINMLMQGLTTSPLQGLRKYFHTATALCVQKKCIAVMQPHVFV